MMWRAPFRSMVFISIFYLGNHKNSNLQVLGINKVWLISSFPFVYTLLLACALAYMYGYVRKVDKESATLARYHNHRYGYEHNIYLLFSFEDIDVYRLNSASYKS